MSTGKVCERKRDADGTRVGKSHTNPLFDTRAYIVEFPDGMEGEYTPNLIAENLYAQCNPDGQQFTLLSSIIDHKRDHTAIEKIDQIFIRNGRQQKKKTTKGWSLCIEWKDGTTT